MTTKHTPGPWTMHPRFDDGAEVRSVASVAWCGVASTVGSSGGQSIDAAEARANAHLIAAAPDLLHVAEMVLRGASDGALYGFAKAAVDKAKGEPT